MADRNSDNERGRRADHHYCDKHENKRSRDACHTQADRNADRRASEQRSGGNGGGSGGRRCHGDAR